MEPFYIAGATGGGKSAVALELAVRCAGEIINADAYQLYRGMDILTAMPTAEDFRKAPHHLYSVLDLSEDSDAASYASLARQCIDTCVTRGVLPIVVGGSGLYIKALTHGLSPLPTADENLRSALADFTLDELAAWLTRLDPAGAAAMNLQNPRYVERALEISLLSGRPASELKRDWNAAEPDFEGVILDWPRQELYERINRRTHAMLDAGAIEEVRGLGKLSTTAEKAIGIREIQAHLRGELSLEEAADQIQQATRRYAKRQITWFRREKGFQSICLNPTMDAKSAVSQILSMFPRLAALAQRPDDA